MNELNFFAAMLIGLAGGVHCFGMCGGIVSALSFAIPAKQAFLPYALAYNVGRICSYTLAGALTGLIGQLVSQQNHSGVSILQYVSGILLILLACYIGNWWHGLRYIEHLGKFLWSRLAPLSKKLLPLPHPLAALPYGMIWGWLPCGLVYSTLSWSLASGSWWQGGLIMLGFGLGTLPIMILIALGIPSVKTYLQHPGVRQILAVSLLLFGLYSLLKASRIVLV